MLNMVGKDERNDDRRVVPVEPREATLKGVLPFLDDSIE
jgi:hypothetical protein